MKVKTKLNVRSIRKDGHKSSQESSSFMSHLGGYMEIEKLNYKDLTSPEKKARLKEIAKVFLRLGIFAFGGPAAHIAMMDEEVVQKRKWIDRTKFMDLIGATNLIPGPNSTEMAIHLGYERGGVLGLFIAGICFIFPAMFIVLVFAMAYARYGTIPKIEGILYGIKPVIIAIVFQALIRLGKSVIKGYLAIVVASLVIAGSFFGVSEIPLLLTAGIFVMVIKNRDQFKTRTMMFYPLPLLALAEATLEKNRLSMGLERLFLTFIKIGSALYGSGYVLLAFLESEFIRIYPVISEKQLLDAVAVGQLTPGPVFTTATFVGYLVLGIPGALVSTAGIFLPSFLLVWLLRPLIPKLRNSKWAGGILDGVNIASLGLMTAVTVRLGMSSLIDLLSVTLFIVALFVLIKKKINSAWVILVAGAIGFISQLL